MDSGEGFVFGVLFGAIFTVLICVNVIRDYEDFTKEHNITPYCIEREVGHEIIKKCYTAQEVK